MGNNYLNKTMKMSLQHIQSKKKFLEDLLIIEWEEIQDLSKQIDFNNLI